MAIRTQKTGVETLDLVVDGGQRWAREIVATRGSEPPCNAAPRDLFGAADDPMTLSASLPGEAPAAIPSSYGKRRPTISDKDR